MSEQKSKKTFLKKGTRQFLSNATVRSLSQKPKIVEFEEDNQTYNNSPFVNVNEKNTKSNKKDDILINVKQKIPLKQKDIQNKGNVKKNSNFIQYISQNKFNDSKVNSFQDDTLISNHKINSSSHKNTNSSNSLNKIANQQKKPTMLTDYLGEQVNKGSTKKPNNLPAQRTFHTKNDNLITHSQAGQLKMQNLDDDDSDYQLKNKIKKQQQNDEDSGNQFMDQSNDKKKQFNKNNTKNQFETLNNKKKPNLLQQVLNNNTRKQKQNINIQPSFSKDHLQKLQVKEEVRFQSDSDEDQRSKKNQFKGKNSKNFVHNNRFRQENQESKEDLNNDIERLSNRNNQNQSVSSQDNNQFNRKATVKLSNINNKQLSKVAQMFNKNNPKNTVPNNVTQIQPEVPSKKMTIQSIPQQLIEEIVQKYFKQAKQKYQKKQQNLFEQVKVVEKKQQSLNQQQKTLEKRMKQFQKQQEQKSKEFENKVKAEQNKITREKMYLKDQQTTGKVDWKTKNQVQQLKQQLEDQRNDKKRIQVKLKGQLERLKVRFNEQMEAKRLLQLRIKDYQLKELKQKQIQKKQEKQQKIEQIQKKAIFWDNAPKNSFLQSFYRKDFSLNQYSVENYGYDMNQFYQYYKQKGEDDILQSQEVEGNKIKRNFQNGKIQTESVQKFIKEVFPWGYSIIHYINGDIKQIIQLPKSFDSTSQKRLQIYYAKNNQIIEYSISDGRQIHYFLSQDQIQLKDQLLQLVEVYNGNQLQKMIKGKTAIYQRNAKGKFIQMY